MCRYATSDVQLVEVSEKDLRQDITGFINNFFGVLITLLCRFTGQIKPCGVDNSYQLNSRVIIYMVTSLSDTNNPSPPPLFSLQHHFFSSWQLTSGHLNKDELKLVFSSLVAISEPKKVEISRVQPPPPCPCNGSARIQNITYGAV